MTPSSMPDPHEPPPTAPSESLPPLSDEERIERLSALVAELEQENAALQSQLTSALASNHTPLLRYGTGTKRCTLSARSIAAMYLRAELKLNTLTPEETGRFSVQADQHSLTEFLPAKEAQTELQRAEAEWEAALTPPTRK